MADKKTKSTVTTPPVYENTTPPTANAENKTDETENKAIETETTTPQLENAETKTEKTENAAPIVETKAPNTENTSIEVANAENKAKRVAKTVNFTDTDEFAYIDGIVTDRVDASITKDWSHFIRQCIDYTINQRFFDADFATGKEDFYLLKDAFFTEAPIKK